MIYIYLLKLVLKCLFYFQRNKNHQNKKIYLHLILFQQTISDYDKLINLVNYIKYHLASCITVGFIMESLFHSVLLLTGKNCRLKKQPAHGGLSLFFVQEFFKFIHERMNILELSVNRSKSDIGNFIEILEKFHSQFSYSF